MTNFEDDVLNAYYDLYHNEKAYYGTKEEWESRFAEIRADERAKIKEMFKMYQRLELKFTLNQCKEKDGLYYLDATELFNGLVDQVIDSEE